MSIESKLASLTLGDEPTVVSLVKESGVEKSGYAANINVLMAKCASKDEKEALAGLKLVKTMAEECPEAEAFTKECLTAGKLLSQADK